MGNKFGAFLAGGLAGAVVALLYAPRSGQETRAMVTDKMSAAWGEAQELGSQAGANMQHAYQDAASKGQEVVQDVAAKGQELYGQATQRVQEKNTISDAPASVHFCTRKSLRSPFGRPANTVERTVGSALHGTTSMTSASASCSSVCTRRHL